jgi:hypothetical protein
MRSHVATGLGTRVHLRAADAALAAAIAGQRREVVQNPKTSMSLLGGRGCRGLARSGQAATVGFFDQRRGSAMKTKHLVLTLFLAMSVVVSVGNAQVVADKDQNDRGSAQPVVRDALRDAARQAALEEREPIIEARRETRETRRDERREARSDSDSDSDVRGEVREALRGVLLAAALEEREPIRDARREARDTRQDERREALREARDRNEDRD